MLKKLLLITIALLAFAGNSVLCRYALKGDVIDASSFTAIRLISGAVFLIGLVACKNSFNVNWKGGSWLSAFWLFLYAAAFSFAYITLKTGIGALILFGAVQVTMILVGLFGGKQLQLMEWFGLILAFSGLAYLLIPSSTSPSLIGCLLMAISGVAWGFYTLAGKGSVNPLVDTANNFLKTMPFVLLLVAIFINFYDIKMTSDGVMLAIVSGAITSGLGYAIWYSVLDTISITQAAVIQLTVPIIAAFGGVTFSSEAITMQLVVSSLLVLGGVFIVVAAKKNKT